MLKTDYILRILEEAVRALTRAKEQRAAGEQQGARDTLDRALEDLVGLPQRQVLAVPLTSLTDLVGGTERFDAPRALLLARLLFECGLAASSHDDARACCRRALCVYDEITRIAPDHPALFGQEDFMGSLLSHLEKLEGPRLSAQG